LVYCTNKNLATLPNTGCRDDGRRRQHVENFLRGLGHQLVHEKIKMKTFFFANIFLQARPPKTKANKIFFTPDFQNMFQR
jgi:hypothetical protein